MSVWFLYPVEQNNMCLSMHLYFLRYQMYTFLLLIFEFMLCFKFLLSIFGLKNTLWDVAIEMSAECYLIIVYACHAVLRFEFS